MKYVTLCDSTPYEFFNFLNQSPYLKYMKTSIEVDVSSMPIPQRSCLTSTSLMKFFLIREIGKIVKAIGLKL